MANLNSPTGGRVISNLNGSPWTGKTREYVALATDTNVIMPGDFVKLTGAGNTNEYGQVVPVVTLAGATDTPVGIVVGVTANPNNLSIAYRPASTLKSILVCDDPNVLFEIQSTGTSTASWLTLLANIVYGAGSTFYNTSGTQLDGTTVGTTGTVIQIMGLSQKTNNSLGQNSHLICRFKLHSYK